MPSYSHLLTEVEAAGSGFDASDPFAEAGRGLRPLVSAYGNCERTSIGLLSARQSPSRPTTMT
jgi:hypothetical protein